LLAKFSVLVFTFSLDFKFSCPTLLTKIIKKDTHWMDCEMKEDGMHRKAMLMSASAKLAMK
jgi:hypothetical protein